MSELIEKVIKDLKMILGDCSERSPRWRRVVVALEILMSDLETEKAKLSSLTDDDGVMTLTEIERAEFDRSKEDDFDFLRLTEKSQVLKVAIATRQNTITSARKNLECQEKVKQERERMLKVIESYGFSEPQPFPANGSEPTIIALTESDWQLLKGGE